MRASNRWLVAAVVGLALPGLAFAQTAPANPPANAHHSAADKPTELPKYVPPTRGSPDARISGATRGLPPVDATHLEALAPGHVGLTLQDQPTFFWSTSRAIQGNVDLVISASATDQVVYKTAIPGPTTAGIYAFSLAGTAAHLEPGAIYQWTVSTVVPGEDAPRTVVVSGQVKRVLPSQVKLTSFASDPNGAAIAYARAGVWYDAISALSQGLQQTPTDQRLHRSRAALLNQIGLYSVANFDR